MSDDPMTVADGWTAWPEDLDPVEATDQLNDHLASAPDSLPDDPLATLIQMFRVVPTTIGAVPALISDGSRMAEDRAAAHRFTEPAGAVSQLPGRVSRLPQRPLPGHAPAPKHPGNDQICRLLVDTWGDRIQRPNRMGPGPR